MIIFVDHETLFLLFCAKIEYLQTHIYVFKTKSVARISGIGVRLTAQPPSCPGCADRFGLWHSGYADRMRAHPSWCKQTRSAHPDVPTGTFGTCKQVPPFELKRTSIGSNKCELSIPITTSTGVRLPIGLHGIQAEAWWRASIWRSHRKVVIKQCSYHNNIIDIQNRLPYSKVVYPAIIVLFSCLMEVNHGVRTGPNYPFR